MRLMISSLTAQQEEGTGKDFYLSSTGSDYNDGRTPSTAWQTIDKLQDNVSEFEAGTTIYLNGGDEFYGSLDLSIAPSGELNNSINITSYGAGKAVLKGHEDITNWVNEGSNIWSADLGKKVFHVIKDDKFAELCRYPKYQSKNQYRNNFSTITEWADNDTVITVPDFIGLPDMTGAIIFTTPRRWYFNQKTVVAFDSATGKVTMDSPPRFSYQGFSMYCFLAAHENYLTKQDEWRYDDDSGKVRVYSTSMPTGFKAVTIDESGFNISNKSYYDINNLTVDGFNQHGISNVQGTLIDNINVDNTIIKNCTNHGFFSVGGTNITLQNSELYYIGTGGVWARNINVNNNIINDVADSLFWNQEQIIHNGEEGYQRTRNGITAMDDSEVHRNIVTNAGYVGIRFDNGIGIITQNYVDMIGLVLSDGAAIYTYAKPAFEPNAGSVVERNILLENPNVIPDWANRGVYLDEQSGGVTVNSNTIQGFEEAILENQPLTGNTITNNNSYLSHATSTWLTDGIGKVYSDNKNFQSEGLNMIHIRVLDNLMEGIGTRDNNRYFNTSQTIIGDADSYDTVNTAYTLPEWQVASGQEANSTDDTGKTITSHQIIYNDSFETVNEPISGTWYDLDLNSYTDSVPLGIFEGMILIQYT